MLMIFNINFYNYLFRHGYDKLHINLDSINRN